MRTESARYDLSLHCFISFLHHGFPSSPHPPLHFITLCLQSTTFICSSVYPSFLSSYHIIYCYYFYSSISLSIQMSITISSSFSFISILSITYRSSFQLPFLLSPHRFIFFLLFDFPPPHTSFSFFLPLPPSLSPLIILRY